MLVIELVVRGVLDHVAEIGLLEDEDTVILEQDVDRLGDGLYVGNVTDNIRGDDGVRIAMGLNDAFCCLRVQEGAECFDPVAARLRGGVVRRLNSKMARTGFGKVFEHGAVVASDLDHERVGPADEILRDPGGVVSEMGDHASGRAGEKRILVVEHRLGRRLIDDLQGAAGFTEGRGEFVEIFVTGLVRAVEPVRDRLLAETHEGGNGRVADAAMVSHALGGSVVAGCLWGKARGACAVWARRYARRHPCVSVCISRERKFGVRSLPCAGNAVPARDHPGRRHRVASDPDDLGH